MLRATQLSKPLYKVIDALGEGYCLGHPKLPGSRPQKGHLAVCTGACLVESLQEFGDAAVWQLVLDNCVRSLQETDCLDDAGALMEAWVAPGT